jgi:hypothetical protein
MIRRAALAFCLFLLAQVNVLGAQTIRGQVIDESTGRPLQSVLLTLLDPDGRDVDPGSRSNEHGVFTLHAPGAGDWRVSAVRIGYWRVTSETVSLGDGEVVTARIVMAHGARAVDPAAIEARRRYSMTELASTVGFDLRRAQPSGTFFTAEELGRYAAFEDIARAGRTPTLTIGGALAARVLHMRVQGRRCFPWLYLDGSALFVSARGEPLEARRERAASALDHLNSVPMDRLYGVEIYRYPQRPPVALAGPFGDADNDCGWIAVWTRMQRRFDAKAGLTPTFD